MYVRLAAWPSIIWSTFLQFWILSSCPSERGCPNLVPKFQKTAAPRTMGGFGRMFDPDAIDHSLPLIIICLSIYWSSDEELGIKSKYNPHTYNLVYLWAWQDFEMEGIFIESIQNYNCIFIKEDILYSSWWV